MSTGRITLVSAASGTYGIYNDNLGQLVNWLVLNDSNWVIISDNNPISSIPRVVTLQYGNCSHFLKLAITGGSTLTISLRNLANTSDLFTGYVGGYLPSGTVIRSIYGKNSTFIMGASSFKISFFKCSDNLWYPIIGTYGGSTNVPYLNSSDNTISVLSLTNTNVINTLGQGAIYQAYIYSGTVFIANINTGWVGPYVNSLAATEGIYTDGINTYALVSSGYTMLLLGDN